MARILIVDDSLIMRRNLKSILTDAGHNVVGEAANGQQAYQEYKQTKPDLVTMDITMPNVDGIDALKNIIDNFPDAKVIMISALDQKSKVFTALRTGAKHYIIKPITSEKVISIVEKVLMESNKKTVIQEKHEAWTDKPPFSIENIDGSFVVTLTDELNVTDILTLDSALQGFLLLKPLSIIFELGIYRLLEDETITRFDVILQKIRSVNGKMEIKSRNKNLVEKLIEKDYRLEAKLNAGEYTIS